MQFNGVFGCVSVLGRSGRGALVCGEDAMEVASVEA